MGCLQDPVQVKLLIMEFLDNLTKNSENCNLHGVVSSNIQSNRELSGEIYQHPDAFTKLVSDPDFDKIPTGSFLAELNDAKNESPDHFADELFHCKQMNENSVRQDKQMNETEHPKPDFLPVLNSDCSYAVISLFPFVCGVCEKKFDYLPGFFEHLTLHNEVTDLLHCCKQTDTGSFQEEKNLYSCGICGIIYPSLCLLYKHMLDVEKVNDFVYKSKDKTVYAHKEDTEKCPVEKLGNKLEDKSEQNNKTSLNSTELERDSKNMIENSVINSLHLSECIKTRKSSKKKIKEQRTRQLEYINSESKKISTHKKSSKVIKKDTKKDRKKNKQSTLDRITESDHITDGDLNVEVLAEWNADNDKSVDDLKISEPWADTNEDKQISPDDTRKKPTNLKNVLFPCEVCGGFYKHQNLQKHRTTHDERTLACDQCPVVFKSQFRLNAHKKQVHVDEKKFTCDVCGKSFKAWPYLKQHRQIHKKDRDIPCPLCPIKFQYKALLRAHLVTHSDDKPHQCDMCERTFKRIDRLNAHKKYFHSEERNFSCPKCNKTFKTRDAMNRHHRIHLPPKYFCHICGKGFVQKYNMRIHQKVHGMFHVPATEMCEQLF